MERATIAGVELAFETSGDPAGRGVVIIHGLTASVPEWRRTATGLARAGWRTLAADNPGHGESSAPEDAAAYEAANIADLLHGLAVERGCAPAVLIGHSWGGMIAEEYAIRHPGDVAALVLVDSAGGGPRAYPPRDEATRALYRREQDIVLNQGMGALWDYHQAHGLWGSVAGAPPETQARLKARFCRTSPQGYLFGNQSLGGRRDTLADLARLTVRTLVVRGEHEDALMTQTSREIAAAIPGARLEVIAGAGHSPHIENPRAFNAALLAFMAQV